MIPVVWKEYRCSMGGKIPKFVECEKCKSVYVYQMTRQVDGVGNSLYFLDNQGAQGRARTAAEEELLKALWHDCDPVPCLNCGHFQEQMVQKIRDGKYPWLKWLAVLGPLAALASGFTTWIKYKAAPASGLPVPWLALTVAVGLVAVVAIVAQIVVATADPNAAPVDERRAQGRERAVTREEFESLPSEQRIGKP